MLEQACRLFAVADRLLDSLDITLSKPDQVEYERDLAEAQAQLSTEKWEELQREGKSMSLDQAVEYALLL